MEANSGQGGLEGAIGEFQENPQTSGSFPESAAPRTLVQEGAGRTTRGSQGSWWPSLPSQELESRVEASSEQGGLEEAIGELQEGSQTSGSFPEPTAFQHLVQEGSGRIARRAQGSLRTSPPSQGLEAEEKPGLSQGGLEEAVGASQGDS